jgi:ATP-binding cassette subfamily F protein 3
VGPNGAGKSTLLRIAAGALEFDAGDRTLGHKVEVAFYAQHQLEVLDSDLSVLEELERGAMTEDVPRLRGHLGAFLFSGDDVKKRVAVLSGGEKARLALAKLLLRPANFLVLDEPTNHLDVDACEVLETALKAYTGTLMLISHDRAFLNALATRIVEVRAGELRETIGNYDDFLRTAGAAPAEVAEAAAPSASGSKQERIAARQRVKSRARATNKAHKRLAALEEEISQLEERLEELAWRAADPEVCRDAERARSVEAERTDVKSAIEAHYREWEGLATDLESDEEDET